MLVTTIHRVIAPSLLAAAWTGAATAGPPNDDCSTPTQISGTGVFAFDLAGATTGLEGQDSPNCDFNGFTGIEEDVWFCWRASCTGLVTISTCGQTQTDTKIALWAGCACPGAAGEFPLCCNDDACNLATVVTCDVVCDQQYMIQLGKVPDGLSGGSGTFTIECEGDPCGDEPCNVVPGACCAGHPQYVDPAYSFTGQVAVGTASPDIVGGAVVTVFDFSDFSSAVVDTSFPIGRYSDPSWTSAELGSVFGVTLDPSGNIYVTSTTSYNADVAGPGGLGAVYRIDSVTGVPSVFATLPNSGQGLGNIAYDCDNDQFFVTNHEDGRIYRIDMAGAILSTFDHGAADDGTSGYAPLGERLWGITVNGRRVWYATWTEDGGRPSALQSNEIWSIGLDGFGDFSGPAQLEITVPPRSGLSYSNPVSDMRFTPAGTLHAAERSMSTDTFPSAHDARLLEFSCENGVWVAGPATYGVGVFSGENSAGGVAVDYSPSGRTWVSGDALHFGAPYGDYIYGYQGLPLPGGTLANSFLFDYNGVTNDGGTDKTKLGDIVISCPGACLEYVAEVECEIGPGGATGKYVVTLTLTNHSGTDAQYVLLPGPNTVPNVITLNPPLPGDGSASETITIQLCDVPPGPDYCFDIVLADEFVDACCEDRICVDLPVCCAEFPEASVSVMCDPDGFVVTFDVQNLTSDVIEHVFVIPLPIGTTVTVTPDYIDVPPIAPGGFQTIGPLLIENAASGEEVCLRVTMHNEDFGECCSNVLCVTMPDCGPPIPCDVNGDGVVDVSDLLLILANWGTCDGTPCIGDLDGNGVVDVTDLLMLLGTWG